MPQQPRATATAETVQSDRQRRSQSREASPAPKKMETDQPDAGQQYDNQNQHANGQQQSSQDEAECKQVPSQPKTPLDAINAILSECQQFKERVNSFSGMKTDKEYKFLEEMLTRRLLKLDGVESGNDMNIRQARRAAVKEIQSYLDQLELTAFSSAQTVPENTNQNASGQSGQNGANISQQTSDAEMKDNTNAGVREMTLDSEVSC